MTSYFVLLLDFNGSHEAIVHPTDTWADIVDAVDIAIGDETPVVFVHHITGSTVTDRTQEAYEQVRVRLADNGEPLTTKQFQFIENNFGFRVANTFGRAA